MSKRKLAFEESLKELEQIVEQLERGDIALEESLRLFAKGIQLARACDQALQEAEQQVRILTADEDQGLKLKAFQIDDQR